MRWLVHGLGESGLCAARALLDRGEKVVVADSGDSQELRHVAESLGTASHLGARPEVLEEGFDRVVASPGIRPRDPL
ncbi:MAG: UDP-N-acetylmuramoyl-L-alanine--D-glutamate ligase, partial [Actinomycetota bacterium]|nr:UDP-N-acetylmuramoyl-L-alanine--D-glutamate ligase [Actinomycetota bacterium]